MAFYCLTVTISICVAMFHIQTAFCQDIPKINREIYPEIKRVGMTGYMNCTVARQGTNKVLWIHKESSIILTSNNRVEIDNSINEVVDGNTKYDVIVNQIYENTVTYTLVVRRLVKTDTGTYTCQVIIIGAKENDYPSKSGQLVVLVPPTIHPSGTTQAVEVLENDNVTLTCTADGYPHPNISWVKVSGNPLPEPWNRFAYRGRVFTLIHIQNADRGWYRCIADNNVRPSIGYDCMVHVHFRPQARAVQKSYGQAQNRLFSAVLECIVAGYPAPDVKWYHVIDGGLRPVIDDDKHRIAQLWSHGQVLQLEEYWFQMTVINVQANDYGIYVCEGTNKYGSGQLELMIFETSECQGPTCPPEGGFITSLGLRVTYSFMTLAIVSLFLTSWEVLYRYLALDIRFLAGI